MYGPAVRCKSLHRVVGLRSCINVSGLSLERFLQAIMDISARAISLCDRPRQGQLGHQCSQAPGRPILHLVSSSRRPRQVRRIDPARSSRAPHVAQSLVGMRIRPTGQRPHSSLSRSCDREPERSRRYAPACWQVQSPARCDAAASWRPRSRA
jgi:hypothetical protein